MSSFNRIVFLGSPDFAVPSLKKLIESEQFRPLAVITQPDRPAGRSSKPVPTPVKLLALENNLSVFQPEDINLPEAVEYLASLKPDLLITVAYGQKLKKAVRATSTHGAINLHPSLLPELRGAAPIPFALWQGSIQTGITIFKLTARMDAGPVYFRKPLFIFPSENATDLTDRLGRIGAKCLLQFLEEWSVNPWEPEAQDEEKATYCRKLDKTDCLLNWKQSANEIHNHIRALSINPGAYTIFRQQQLKILDADVVEHKSSFEPGSIVHTYKNIGFTVQAGDFQLLIKLVQPCGKKIMSAWAYHLGTKLEAGERMNQDE